MRKYQNEPSAPRSDDESSLPFRGAPEPPIGILNASLAATVTANFEQPVCAAVYSFIPAPRFARIAPFRAAFPLVPLRRHSGTLASPLFRMYPRRGFAEPVHALFTVACKGAYTTGPLNRLPRTRTVDIDDDDEKRREDDR